jgi:hypothetical protein
VFTRRCIDARTARAGARGCSASSFARRSAARHHQPPRPIVTRDCVRPTPAPATLGSLGHRWCRAQPGRASPASSSSWSSSWCWRSLSPSASPPPPEHSTPAPAALLPDPSPTVASCSRHRAGSPLRTSTDLAQPWPPEDTQYVPWRQMPQLVIEQAVCSSTRPRPSTRPTCGGRLFAPLPHLSTDARENAPNYI